MKTTKTTHLWSLIYTVLRCQDLYVTKTVSISAIGVYIQPYFNVYVVVDFFYLR